MNASEHRITFRLPSDLRQKADRLVGRIAGLATRSAVLRYALKRGLLSLEAESKTPVNLARKPRARPAGLSYAREKLGHAVQIIATSPEDAKVRLKQAALAFIAVSPKDFPEELQGDFEWIKMELTKRPELFPGDGTLNGTLHGMRAATSGKILERIYDLSNRLDEWDTDA